MHAYEVHRSWCCCCFVSSKKAINLWPICHTNGPQNVCMSRICDSGGIRTYLSFALTPAKGKGFSSSSTLQIALDNCLFATCWNQLDLVWRDRCSTIMEGMMIERWKAVAEVFPRTAKWYILDFVNGESSQRIHCGSCVGRRAPPPIFLAPPPRAARSFKVSFAAKSHTMKATSFVRF